MELENITKIIKSAFGIYAKNWKSIVAPFVVIMLISVVLGAMSSFFANFVDGFCQGTNNSSALTLFCVFSQISGLVIMWVSALATLAVTIIAIRRIWAVMNEGSMPSWREEVKADSFTALKIIVARIAIIALIYVPFIVLVILNVGALAAAVSIGPTASILLSSGLMLAVVAVGIVSSLVVLIALLFLSFFEMEVVINGEGLITAMKRSASLVWRNILTVFVFDLIWFVLELAICAMMLVLCCTLCFAPLAYIISPLVFTPVQWISRMELWKELSSEKKK